MYVVVDSAMMGFVARLNYLYLAVSEANLLNLGFGAEKSSLWIITALR